LQEAAMNTAVSTTHPSSKQRKEKIMSPGIQRSVFRWIHIILAIPIIGYIYSPFDQIPNYAPATRFVFVPVLVLSGLWMWKGHVVRRFIWKRSVQQTGM
jgi:hypothetical protein